MRRWKIMTLLALFAGVALSSASTAGVSTYRYDPLGRLVTSCLTTASQGYKTAYSFDPSDNRQVYGSATTTLSISVGNGIYSADGRFHLVLQTDGNFVLYGPSGALWASNTAGTGAQVATFQSDGNLVLYTSTGSVPWASGTYAPCANIALQNDGNLVIYNIDGQAAWNTHTGGH